MKIGVASEGPTDIQVIRALICGYFENDDLYKKINPLQPNTDATDNYHQGGYSLIGYLGTQRFREDICNVDYLIIQFDTDISHEKGIGIPELQKVHSYNSTEVIELIKNRMISEIEKGKSGLYMTISEKLIFCISEESIECWLNAHYNEACLCKTNKKSCEVQLNAYFKSQSDPIWDSLSKKPKRYEKASEPFYTKENINNSVALSVSMNAFINNLTNIALS